MKTLIKPSKARLPYLLFLSCAGVFVFGCNLQNNNAMASQFETIAYKWASEHFDLKEWASKIGGNKIFVRFKHKPKIANLNQNFKYYFNDKFPDEILEEKGKRFRKEGFIYIYIHYRIPSDNDKIGYVIVNQNGPGRKSGENWRLDILPADFSITKAELFSVE